jgi:hypothetical protein
MFNSQRLGMGTPPQRSDARADDPRRGNRFIHQDTGNGWICAGKTLMPPCETDRSAHETFIGTGFRFGSHTAVLPQDVFKWKCGILSHICKWSIQNPSPSVEKSETRDRSAFLIVRVFSQQVHLDLQKQVHRITVGIFGSRLNNRAVEIEKHFPIVIAANEAPNPSDDLQSLTIRDRARRRWPILCLGNSLGQTYW